MKEQGSEDLLQTLWGSRVFSHVNFTCQDAFGLALSLLLLLVFMS